MMMMMVTTVIVMWGTNYPPALIKTVLYLRNCCWARNSQQLLGFIAIPWHDLLQVEILCVMRGRFVMKLCQETGG